MAQINWFGPDALDIRSGFGFASAAAAGLNGYSYIAANGLLLRLTGQDITTDLSGLPISGTVTGIQISTAGNPPVLLGEISGLDVQASALVSAVGVNQIRNMAFWHSVLDGDTEFQGAQGTRLSFSMGALDIEEGSFAGGTETVRGTFDAMSRIVGVAERAAATAVITGGMFDFNGIAPLIVGDVAAARGTVLLRGGDDRIVLIAPVASDYIDLQIRVHGDVINAYEAATIIGGDDYIDASAVMHPGGTVRIVGDVENMADTSRLIGGDDTLIGARNLSNEIFGDAALQDVGSIISGGNDIIYGGRLADTIFGDGGSTNGTVHGGDDTIFGGGGDDIIFGDGGNDRIDLGSGINDAFGGDGDDYFRAAADGVSLFDGGAGQDTISYFASPFALRIDLDKSTLRGGFATNDLIFDIENVFGTQHNDFIYGTAARNDIWGARGNDLIYGRGGGDYIYAGPGDDTIVAAAGGNTYDGGANRDTLDYSASTAQVFVDLQSGRNWGGLAQGDSITQIENLVGTGLADDLRGDSGRNFLRGEAGDDSLIGRGGADLLSGLSGADSLFGGDGNDRIFGGSGNDRIQGDSGRDQMWGGADSDDFHYAAGYGVDRIKDFQDDIDSLIISGLGDPRNLMTQSGNDVRFDFGAGNVLIVEDVLVAQLTDDIQFV